MGVKMTGRLVGATGIELKHEDSGSVIRTSPPADNGGDGSSFSPTDLAAASLGACAATTLALYAQRNGIPLTGVSFEVEKLMHLNPRRLGRVVMRMKIDSPCSDEDFARLAEAGKGCPVKRSLAPEVEIDETYERG
ncbi:MAG: OsmC family protein [Thermoanaerobaculia bacterium]